MIESVFYFAVPIFFMISGATLIDYSKRYSTKTFLKKRFSKTLIPFLFWSILALVYLLHYHKIDITNFSLITLLDLILNSKLFPIYWFFMPLFGLYLSMPLLSAVDKTFKGYLSPMSILYASALFVFFRYASFDKMKGLNKIINFLRETTFGIYLIHYFIIYHLCYIIQINRYSIVFRTFGAIAIFLTAALIVKILKRIPVIKQLV
ncbi:acyltransferase family protein [Sharpea azabuensis]|uniref:acyltransferase family protein n=1 Tax=Sharpea azabuensis TaxID=322505 RepID=UPI0030C72CEF